jgi:hypothetical protein
MTRQIIHKIGFIILILILIASCKKSRILNENQELQIYSLINNYLLDSLHSVDIMAREVMVFKHGNENFEDPPPPPGHDFDYSDGLFTELIESKIIDSSDLKSFQEQMIPRKQFILNPLKLKIKTFSIDSLDTYFSKNQDLDIWGYFRKKYNSRSMLIISLPLFSKDENSILVSVNIHCGGLCGGGYIYVFKKINGKWTTVFSKNSWVS